MQFRYAVVRLVKTNGEPCYDEVWSDPTRKQGEESLSFFDRRRRGKEQYTLREVPFDPPHAPPTWDESIHGPSPIADLFVS